jgi:hypothetical protein
MFGDFMNDTDVREPVMAPENIRLFIERDEHKREVMFPENAKYSEFYQYACSCIYQSGRQPGTRFC